jgi:hypothetical protein
MCCLMERRVAYFVAHGYMWSFVDNGSWVSTGVRRQSNFF